MTGDVLFGTTNAANLRLELLGYKHPDVAEPDGLDLIAVRAHATAAPIEAAFDLELAVYELRELADYLTEINSGNGPAKSFDLAGGLLSLSFAPSRRGPILCAVRHKNIDASHLRIEYLVTLEPNDVTRCVTQLKSALFL
ncbi:MAG TPA: hypothetical protein VIG46_03335 [Candidatus Baltobacteraceae bacterium]|jgi:hypothetical protein